MRKCIRCGAEMIEGCGVRQSDSACGVVIMESEKFFAKTIGRLKAAVCPECGEVSLYIDQTETLKHIRQRL